jgi:hypothetical protein
MDWTSTGRKPQTCSWAARRAFDIRQEDLRARPLRARRRHASVWNIFEQMKIRLPMLDRVTSALIEDLHDRGLDKDVRLVVMGEMSHTPKLNYHEGQPGREHRGSRCRS